MNAAHKIGRLRNRLKRLVRRTPDVGPDRQGAMVARMKEIEGVLKIDKPISNATA